MTEDKARRLMSLDVFRGLTVAGMILVNSPGNGTAYWPLEHAEWNGLTPTDLVFPFFVFILGVSLVFSFSKRLQTASSADLGKQILKRTAIIFGLGLLLNGFPYNHLESIRIPGVLQRIALCYFFAALLHWRFTTKQIVAITITLLVGYWLLMTQFPVPGFGAGILTPEANLAAFIDRHFLSGHMYTPLYDPEGILSTLPAVATGLLGVLSGRWLLSSGRSPREKAIGLAAGGLVTLNVGLAWSLIFPINKALWTSSYVLVTGGLALLLFAALYALIDVNDNRRHWTFFEVFGVNALAGYVLSIFDLKIQNRIPISVSGVPGNLRLWITHTLFEHWASPELSSMLYAMCHTFIWYLILSALYRRRILIKV